MRLSKLGFVLCLSILVGGWACQQKTPAQVAMTARDSIANASAFVGNEEKTHPECAVQETVSNTTKICSLLHDGKVGVNLAVDALHQFCASPDYDKGGPCTPNANLQNQLEAALSHVNQVISDIKAVK